MALRANAYRVNVICILILFMIWFSYARRLNEVKTDGLNTAEVCGLCLLGENDFGLFLMKVPKLPRKNLIFLLLPICGDIELCPGLHVQENLTDMSKLRGIKLIHQNISCLLSKKDILETSFTNEKFIITFSETYIASVNSELFQIPGFKFVHKNRIAGEGGKVAMYLSNDLKWKRRTDLKQMEQSVFGWTLTFLKVKVFLLVAFIDPRLF